MSSSDLPKLWRELTKSGHIFRKQRSTFYLVVFLEDFFFSEIFHEFSTLRNVFENQNLEILGKAVHDFGKSDDDMIKWKFDFFFR